MKKLIFEIVLLILVIFAPVSAMSEIRVQVTIPIPPPIIFPAPPELVVIPETYVYAMPDVQEEIFFYNGWWWRPWEGRWYRSRYYDRGWVHYHRVPSFYSRIHPGWRDDYRDHRWRGYQWEHQRVPYHELQRNWHGWQKDRHWEKQNSWGIQGLPPRQHPSGAVKHQPPPPQHHEAQPQREVRPQPRPVPSREIKARDRYETGRERGQEERRPSGEVNRQGRPEREMPGRPEKR